MSSSPALKNWIVFLFSLLLIITVIPDAKASSIQYSLSGSLTGVDGKEKEIWGTLFISDELTYTGFGYAFYCSQFSLFTDDIEFTGQGSLYLGEPIGNSLGDLIWGLWGYIAGTGYNWIGEEFTFSHSDGTPYGYTFDQYSNLPSQISMYDLSYGSGLPVALDGSLNILAQRNPAPIPEPSPLLLVLIGTAFSLIMIREKIQTP